MLIGTLGGVELGLAAAGVPFRPGGVQAALATLTGASPRAAADAHEERLTAG
jgi:alanine-glyoxylate transaminase/serine-glyoxylate transaminase/serine-pyruvate transaminase